MDTHNGPQPTSETSVSTTPQEHDNPQHGLRMPTHQERRRPLPEQIILRRLWRIYEMALAAAERAE